LDILSNDISSFLENIIPVDGEYIPLNVLDVFDVLDVSDVLDVFDVLDVSDVFDVFDVLDVLDASELLNVVSNGIILHTTGINELLI
jgi:hypothetical protein